MSKFINKGTEEYLKSKAGANVQSQIKLLSADITGIDLVTTQLDQRITDQTKLLWDRINAYHDLLTDQYSALRKQGISLDFNDKALNAVGDYSQNLDRVLRRLIRLTAVGFILLGGLIAWVLIR